MGKLQEELRASNEKLAQLATTDSLTGLNNRRHFYLELEDEIQRARRFGQSMSVIMFDLDHFKRINDSWGHSQGDLVLQAFSRVLENIKRSIDTVARLGGEEFIALLPATGFDGAFAFAEKVRLATEKMSVPGFPAESDATTDSKITVSAGAAVAVRLEPTEESQAEESQAEEGRKDAQKNVAPTTAAHVPQTHGHPAPHMALHNAQHDTISENRDKNFCRQRRRRYS